ncbi:MAG: glycosyl hydrolase family 28-related protein, partial [Geminicoccaceae bacterium]
MVSAIDPSKPVDGVPAVKADLRANLLAAKNEIEALQTVAAASVKQFGAVGDGSTDDLDAFQNAIDAVSGDGGIVFVPASPDPYIIDGTLALKANVILAGESAGSILKLADGANVTLVEVTGSTPHFGLRDLILHCNRAQQNGDASKFGLDI